MQSNDQTYPTPFDVHKIRSDFPILSTQVKGKPLVYLDSAASAQKPTCVIEAVKHYYETSHANVHRGVHHLSDKATQVYEDARKLVAAYLNTKSTKEIIFTRNATEGFNLIAQTWGKTHIQSGDEIILSILEHHANIVPWRMLADETGAIIKVIPIDEEGNLKLDEYKKLFSSKTKVVAVNYISNTLGTINPVQDIIRIAKEQRALTIIDGTQAIPHMPVDVQALDCDFFVFTGHKAFGPTGIGVVYGKADVLRPLPPYQGGGDMIELVSFDKVTFRDIPTRYEAGTPNIAGAAGLKAAIEYMQRLDWEGVKSHEQALLEYATEQALTIPGLRIYGTCKNKASIISFSLECAHPHDIATILNSEGVAIRAGHHCTQPLMKHLGVPATGRASFTIYNTREEVDIWIEALRKTVKLFS